MQVKKVYLENFLSYENLFAEFEEDFNVLVGSNAAGKTNLLESMYYSSLGKSARGLKDKELINWDGEKDHARVRILVQKKYAKHTVDVYVDKQGKKRITIDGLPIARIGELLGVLCVVYFSPAEIKLIKESPADRRRFMDVSLCQQDRSYYYALVTYNKLLAQRNKMLKEYKNTPSLTAMNEIIVGKMCDEEVKIIRKRKDFLERLAPLAAARHTILTSGKERLEIAYETEEIDENDVKGSLKSLYDKSFEKDARLEYTSVGVHRDDVRIKVDDVDVRKFGSQGQQRTAALSMKLAEVTLFFEESGEYPVLLMDDVLSELDESRRKALFEGLDGVQTFVTCTDFHEKIQGNKTIYEIKDRKVKKL